MNPILDPPGGPPGSPPGSFAGSPAPPARGRGGGRGLARRRRRARRARPRRGLDGHAAGAARALAAVAAHRDEPRRREQAADGPVLGLELHALYNDAYAAILAERHPRALGRPARELWPELWHRGEPQLLAVLRLGEAVFHEELRFTLERHGRREEAFFSIAETPVRVEDGSIGGVLLALQETTAARERAPALARERGAVPGGDRELARRHQPVRSRDGAVRPHEPGAGLR